MSDDIYNDTKARYQFKQLDQTNAIDVAAHFGHDTKHFYAPQEFVLHIPHTTAGSLVLLDAKWLVSAAGAADTADVAPEQ